MKLCINSKKSNETRPNSYIIQQFSTIINSKKKEVNYNLENSQLKKETKFKNSKSPRMFELLVNSIIKKTRSKDNKAISKMKKCNITFNSWIALKTDELKISDHKSEEKKSKQEVVKRKEKKINKYEKTRNELIQWIIECNFIT